MAAVEVDEDSLMSRQKKDPELASNSNYLEKEVGQEYCIDIIPVHHSGRDSLPSRPPTDSRERLFQVAHGGAFGAHLGDTKVHIELRKLHYHL